MIYIKQKGFNVLYTAVSEAISDRKQYVTVSPHVLLALLSEFPDKIRIAEIEMFERERGEHE